MKNNNESDPTWIYIKTLYEKCFDLPPGERTHFLHNQCQSDSRLREEVESLLDMNDDANDPRPACTSLFQLHSSSHSHGHEWIGKDIGSYRILKLIARGGMGAVFLAMRHDGSYDKNVAIKLLDQKFVSDPQFLKRFKCEQQTLANLDHPNITKLLDGGLTTNDVPYIIMEYVEGVRIDNYCSKNALSQTQRLQLFCLVCSAVQYANQNLIVHRDLKPSNILVAPDGTPKLLDFGISKVFDPQDQLSSELTLPAMRIFTPRYASPEQRSGQSMTTLCDVFSLGVILYELLVDGKPFTDSPANDDSSHTNERKTDPIRPRSIDKSFPVDLETILLKAISHDPKERYQSASALSEDVQRFITNQPIHARTPSHLYQFRKLVSRHKWTSITVATLVVCLIGLSTGMTILYTQANQETRKANEVVDILEGIFTNRYSNWFSPENSHVAINFRIADAIEYAENCLNSGAPMNVSTRFKLHRLLGKAFYHIHDDRIRALRHLKAAHELNSQRYSARHPKIAESLMNLGYLETSPDLRVQHFQQAYAIRRDTFGEENIDTLMARLEWGGALLAQGNLELGESATNEGMAKLEIMAGSDIEIFGRCLIREGSNYISGGFRKKGEAALTRALKYSYNTKNKLTSISVLTALSMNAFFQGELDVAEDYASRSVSDLRHVVEKYHPASVTPLWWLGHLLSYKGKTEEAIPILQESLLIARVAYGITGSFSIRPLQDLAGIEWANGDYVEAEKHFRELVELTKRHENHMLYEFGFRNSLAVVLRDAGKYDESLQYFEESHRLALQQYGPFSLRTARVENNMARLLLRRGDLDRAERLILRVLEVRNADLTTDVFDIIESKMVYGMILTKMGRLEDAECLLRDAYNKRVGLFAADHRQVAEAKIALSDWLIADGQIVQAENLLEQSLKSLQSQYPDQHVLIRLAKQSLASINRKAHVAVSSQPLEKLSYSLSR